MGAYSTKETIGMNFKNFFTLNANYLQSIHDVKVWDQAQRVAREGSLLVMTMIIP
jgi:hypothetical protein